MTHYSTDMRHIKILCGEIHWTGVTNVKAGVDCPACLALMEEAEPVAPPQTEA